MLFFHIIFTILLVNYVNCFIYQLNQRRDFLFNHLKSPEINTISTHSDVFSPGNDQIYANPTVESQTNSHNLNTLQDEFGLRIPRFHSDDEVVRRQLMYYGPEIPQELWVEPQRPVGFFGKNNVSPEGQFMPARRAIVVRARRRKYFKTIYHFVRKRYKEYIRDSRTIGELMYWKYKLDALPKDSSPAKFHHYCPISGRFRAYYGFFGLGRHFLREFVNLGYVPGVRPANW
eukprot:XP_765435.1 hypothetical protein [Theileria parva strain Muguga]